MQSAAANNEYGPATHDEVAAATAKFGNATSPQQMSVRESVCLSIALARTSAQHAAAFDLVVGIANGALLPAKAAADELGIPFEIVKVRRKGSRYKQRLLYLQRLLHVPTAVLRWGPMGPLIDLFQRMTGKLEESTQSFSFDVAGKRVLLVDDCIVTGATLAYVARKLIEAGAVEVVKSVICWCDVPGRDVPRPDYHLHRQIAVYPWSGDSRSLGDFTAWLSENDLSLWE
jgi:adenine/guanine phosphoribosyltransferase-like PRPP-binding protein